MYCVKCGNEIPEGAVFCPHCGTPARMSEPEMTPDAERWYDDPEETPASPERPDAPEEAGWETSGQYVTENVVLCPDGVYRWSYEFSMLRNPAILITVLKIFGSLILAGVLFLLYSVVKGSGGDMEEILEFLRGAFLFTLFFFALILVSYLILAAQYGWTYMVLFEMNDKEIRHIQMQKQFDKAKAMGWLSFAAGLATGNFGAAGAGILAASRNTSTSVLGRVTKVLPKRRRHTIYVNQGLFHNQVYADDADFDFIMNFICDHVPAKARKGA
ncbi:MAG: zinc ribbon domain-containing protein [Lachnospiraceae bacterium]|nr:zinc ribbon domain-containing protein [Lachnospiraceae bacterium]